jgi:hypothetical protein
MNTPTTIAMDQFSDDDTQVFNVKSPSLLDDSDRYASSEEVTGSESESDNDSVYGSRGSPAPAPPSPPAREPSGKITVTINTDEYETLKMIRFKKAAGNFNNSVKSAALAVLDCEAKLQKVIQTRKTFPKVKATTAEELLKLLEKSQILEIAETDSFKKLCEAAQAIRTAVANAKKRNKNKSGAGKK